MLDLNFLRGMIKSAVAQGIDPEKMAYIHGRLSILLEPNVRAGFDRALANYSGPVKKSSLAVAMQPELLAAAVEHTIQEGGNPLSDELRTCLPQHQALTETFKEAATAAGKAPTPDFLTRFERMKLSDKLTLLSSVGAGAGGAASLFRPSQMDQAMERSPLARTGRGAVRGAGVATGAGLGAMAGQEIASRLNPGQPGRHPLAMLLGAGVGGLAGNQLASSVL